MITIKSFWYYAPALIVAALMLFSSCKKDDDDNGGQHTYITDIDGNKYRVVTIGDQQWMAGNLRVKSYTDGTLIPEVESGNQWSNDTAGALCWYRNDPIAYKEAYGALYNYYAVLSGNLCPSGWRVPTDEDWKILEGRIDSQFGVGDSEWDKTDFRGYDAGKKLKSTTGWDSGGNGMDSHGFSGLPGGFRESNGTFVKMGSQGRWWAAPTTSQNTSWYRVLYSEKDNIHRESRSFNLGYSVRCIKE